MTRKLLLLVIVVMLLALIAACGTAPEPQKIIETVVVKETVVVAGTPQVVEKVVTQEVEKIVTKEVEKVVTVEAAQSDAAWAYQPMAETVTVVLSVESGAQEKTLGLFHDEIMKKLNIDLQVVAHPFSEQYEIQYLDLTSGAGQFDILSYWPMYTADFYQWLVPLGEIAPGGDEQVAQDIEFADVQNGYKWAYQYKGKFYSVQYDGDVKLLNYRKDLATDPKELAAFKEKYGYEFDVTNLTWDQYLDVAEFFQRPDKDFYGASEIAGFLAGFGFKDRMFGMGGHLFDYEKMNALDGQNFDICVAAMQNAQDTFNKVSPPEAHSFEFEDSRNQIIVHDRVMFQVQWPDVWKWANDPAKGSKTSVCNVAVAEMPGFEKDGKVIHRPEENGGRVLAINRASRNPEAAYKVLVFFADKERTKNLVFNNETWLDPYRNSHLQLGTMLHLAPGCDDNKQQYIDVINQSTVDGYPALQIPGAGRYHEVVERWSKKAFANQVTPEEACTGVQTEFNQITDEIGRDTQIKEYQEYVDLVLKPKKLWP